MILRNCIVIFCLFLLNSSISLADLKDFTQFQWGIVNLGVPQSIDLNTMQSYKLSAKKGEDIHAPVFQKQSRQVIVAVLDTGIDKSHPDLISKIYTRPSECQALKKYQLCLHPLLLQISVSNLDIKKECDRIWINLSNPEVDQDKNGYPMDCQGWSVIGDINPLNILGTPEFEDELGHGTHIAGIIASVGKNISILPVRVINDAPNQPLKPTSVFDDPTEKTRSKIRKGDVAEDVARGIIYAVRSGAEVINLSLGFPQLYDSPFLRNVIKEAQGQGVFFVSTAGNDSTKSLVRPCSYEDVICVGAHSPDGSISNFSNYSSGVDIAAPGVNILSTYPVDKRPIFFRAQFGYEYLSGTSQAAPFVSAAIAEMIAMGIPKSEIYPRLVLGSRPTLPALTLLKGPNHSIQDIGIVQPSYQKYFLGGNLDITKSINISAQPLIVPKSKEKTILSWDRKSSKLQWSVALKNKWQPIPQDQVELNFSFANGQHFQIQSVVSEAPYKEVWGTNEEREFLITFNMQRGFESELELVTHVKTPFNEKTYILEADVIVTINKDFQDSDLTVHKINNLPTERYSLRTIDENLDSQSSTREYFAFVQKQNQLKVWVISQNANLDYTARGPLLITVPGDLNYTRSQVFVRTDWNLDGSSEYVLGFLEQSEEHPRKMTFYVMNKEAQLLHTFSYDNVRSPIPSQPFWQAINGKKMPAWVGYGKPPTKKLTLRDLWENPDQIESTELQFFYLDKNNTLQSISEYKNFSITDALQPTLNQQNQGIIPILLTQNLGTGKKPSYLTRFATAEVINGEIKNFQEIPFFATTDIYRNLEEARINRVLNLDVNLNEFIGNFWSGTGILGQQRLTMMNNLTQIVTDNQLASQWKYFDAALNIPAAYIGSSQFGAFIFTNTEMEYHNLVNQKVSTRSLEKYSFFPNIKTIAIHFPLMVLDSQNPNQRVPALFVLESSGLNRGIKVFMPHNSHIIAPAHLRLIAGVGCRPIDSLVFLAELGAYALDYDCGDRLLRIKLSSE